MEICLAAVLSATVLARLPAHVTLAWEHTVEKVRWEEDYVAHDRALELVEARVRGTGAGMEMPAEAELVDGAWRYRPRLPPLREIYLRNTELPLGYDLCWNGACQRMRTLIGLRDDMLVLVPCTSSSAP